MPLISHQLRVDEVIAEDLDVDPQARRERRLRSREPDEARPEVDVEHRAAQRRGPPRPRRDRHRRRSGSTSTTSSSPSTRTMPFAGPIDASVSLAASWRQKRGADRARRGRSRRQRRRRRAQRADLGRRDLGRGRRSAYPEGRCSEGVQRHGRDARTGRRGERLVPAGEAAGRRRGRDRGVSVGHLHVLRRSPVRSVRLPVRGFVHGDVGAKVGSGFVTAAGSISRAVTNGKIEGHGGAFVAFDVDASKAKGDRCRSRRRWSRPGATSPMRRS